VWSCRVHGGESGGLGAVAEVGVVDLGETSSRLVMRDHCLLPQLRRSRRIVCVLPINQGKLMP
jgi:hypothetical protein